MSDVAEKLPVTVLTGYLGAGKTTLLNRILSEHHGKKYAVVINEYGEIGIDNDLVVGADEEIFEMNNGCICCRVRGDLIRVLGKLIKRKGMLDGILIETTGVADPGPVAQTFFVDDDIQSGARLDSIVTIVDARHLMLRLNDSPEAEEQVAFADVIVLNKIDLVSETECALLETRIRLVNPYAQIIKAERCNVPIDEMLNRGSFDLDRILSYDPFFLVPDEGDDHEHDADCSDPGCGHPDHDHDHEHFHPITEKDYMDDGEIHLHRRHKPKHDATIQSVSLQAGQPLDPEKFNSWLQELVATQGQNLLRYKGILDLRGEDEQFVVQGIHMVMEGKHVRKWPEGENRRSRLVFIGRQLDAETLQAGFDACQVA